MATSHRDGDISKKADEEDLNNDNCFENLIWSLSCISQ